jgi:hypothetical protein
MSEWSRDRARRVEQLQLQLRKIDGDSDAYDTPPPSPPAIHNLDIADDDEERPSAQPARGHKRPRSPTSDPPPPPAASVWIAEPLDLGMGTCNNKRRLFWHQ